MMEVFHIYIYIVNLVYRTSRFNRKNLLAGTKYLIIINHERAAVFPHRPLCFHSKLENQRTSNEKSRADVGTNAITTSFWSLTSPYIGQ
jgi:hypothetical protein